MKLLLCSSRIVVLVVVSWLVAPGWSAGESSSPNGIGDYMDRLEKLGFAGSVVIMQDDVPIIAEGYGIADREEGIPWTPATVSTIGSITKQFTGAAILKLTERDLVRVDEPISTYLAGVPPDKRAITVHHLLTHTSGIVDLGGVDDWDPIGREEFVRRAMASPLAFEPGAGYEYSNAGYSLLGAIIERVTGRTYEVFLREELFFHNGMFETGYVLPRWGEERLAQGYSSGSRWGTVLERPMSAEGPFWVLRANGGIHSTPWDMVRWGRALIDGTALSDESMDVYWAPHVDEGGGDSFYSYGWVIVDRDGTLVVTHNGGNGIFFADMALAPDAGLVAIVMTNVASDFPMADRLLEQFGAHLLGGTPLPEVPEVEERSARKLQAYAGDYLLADEGVLKVETEAGGLVISASTPSAFSLLHSTRPVDEERADRLSARIEEITRAYVAGDFGPLWKAYGRSVSEEALRDRGIAQLKRLEELHGQIQTFEVLGTAFRDGRDVTLMRLDFERGEAFRAYVWDPEERESLLGVSRRGLDSRLHVIPTSDGHFATWDVRTGHSAPVRFTETFRGTMHLAIRGGSQVEARRTPPPSD